MANYATTVKVKARVKASQQFSSAEQREITPSILGLALQNQSISIPDVVAERTHEKRVVDVNYLKKNTSALGTAKAALHTGTMGDSGATNVTYVTQVANFAIPRKLADNNIFGYQEIFNNEYVNAWRKLRTAQNTAGLDYLIANRCQLSASDLAVPVTASGAGTWDDTIKGLEVSQSDKNFILQKAESFMNTRYFGGSYDFVVDPRISDLMRYLINQGAGNNQSLTWQFGNSRIIPHQGIISSAFTSGSGIIMPTGALAGLVWNDTLNKKGVSDGGEIGTFGTDLDPFGSGAVADFSMYTKRSDTSADTASGSTQDLMDYWEFTLTVGYVTDVLSATGDGVAHLVGLTV
jgi:hypothetical protein